MSNFAIILDSSCDIPDDLCKEYDIILSPHYFTLDSETYIKDNRKEMTNEEFYNRIIKDKIFPKTAYPTIPDFTDLFTKYLDKGIDIICMSISSKFSGQFQALQNIKETILENYPDRKIEIIDSKQVSVSEGFLAIETSRMRAAGYDIDKTVNIINKLVDKGHVIVTVDSLEHLKRGGRIGKSAALAGTILNIKPIITLEKGELIPHSKIRGRKKALNEIVDIALNLLEYDPKDYNINIIHSVSLEDAYYVFNSLTEKTNFVFAEKPWEVGVIVGTHIGPTAVAICLMPKYEVVEKEM